MRPPIQTSPEVVESSPAIMAIMLSSVDFAAARRSHQDEEFARLDLDSLEYLHWAIRLGDMLDR
jgi:hypothetical protein